MAIESALNTRRLLRVAGVAVCAYAPAAGFAEESKLTDQDLLLARNPIVIKDRLRFAHEFADREAGGHSHKMTCAAVHGFGFNGYDKNVAVALEAPFLVNQTQGLPHGEGVGDLKLTLGHLAWDAPEAWRAGWYVQTEFDTAAAAVQTIANQRTQMAVGIGASRPLCERCTLSSSLQYRWSLDEGATTGRKEEWEAHLTVGTKLTDRLSLHLDSKLVLHTVGGSQLFQTLEPSAGWTFGANDALGLLASCEIPFFHSGSHWVAKAGIVWFF